MTTESEASFQEIYNMLLAGEKLQMQFQSRSSAERFRIRMHQLKTIQEDTAVSVGMMQEHERMTFSFSINPPIEPLPGMGEMIPVVATMVFRNKAPVVLYKIKKLENDAS